MMKPSKIYLKMCALLLAVMLVLVQVVPAFPQETIGVQENTPIEYLESCLFNTESVLECVYTEKCVPSDSELGTANTLNIKSLGDITIDETNFPDANFRAWLKDSANIGGAGSDSVLTLEEISGITQIYMDRQGIRDLTGIELFTSLTALMCAYNYNPFTVPNGLPDSLLSLFVMGNDLTELPPLPPTLEVLNCSDNRLTELSPLPSTLLGLDCSNNDLTKLDLAGLDSLSTLPASFKASGQTAYIALLSDGMGNFETAIELNAPAFGSTGISYADGKLKSSDNTVTQTTFTVQTGKEGAVLSGTLHLSYPAEGSIEINAANFPDANFRAVLKNPGSFSGIGNMGQDGYLSPDEIAKITYLNLNSKGISDLTGIAFFTALESLNCNQNDLVALTNLPSSLVSLDCSKNQLTALPSLPGSLLRLDCSENRLTALPALPDSLKRLDCSKNSLTALPTLPDGLFGLDCSYNPLTTPPTLPDNLWWLTYRGIGPMLPATLPVSLVELDYSGNGLTMLDLARLTSLEWLDCSDNNLMTIDLSKLNNLIYLNCSGNRLDVLDLSNLHELEVLICAGNMLTTLDMTAFSKMEILDCSANWLSELNVSGLESLYDLNCAGNSFATLNVSGLSNLEQLNCSGNLLTVLNLEGLDSLDELNCSSNRLTALDLSSFAAAPSLALLADDQTPRITLLGNDTVGYAGAITLNNPVGLAAGISYDAGFLKSAGKTVTTTPFSVDTDLAGYVLSGTMLLAYGDGTSPTIITTSLPGGTVGTAYSQTLGADGDTPITWSMEDGNLPDGLSLSGNTISGTPAVRGTFNFTVKAENNVGSDTKALSIIIAPAAPSIYTITATAGSGGTISPDGAVSVTEGGSKTFTITPAKGFRIASVTVDGINQGAISSFTFNNVTDNHTINAAFSFTGDNSGGSGGRSTSSTPKQAFNAEVSVDGKTSVTLPINIDENRDSAAINIDAELGDNMAGGGNVIINLPSISHVNSYTLGIPVLYLSALAEHGVLTLNTDAGSITVPSNMLTGVANAYGNKAQITMGQGDKSNLSEDIMDAIGDRPLIQLTLSIDGKQTNWSNPEAPVTVSIPYTPTAVELINPESIVVWYIDGSGKVISVPNGRYDLATGTVTFSTIHFSCYAVSYNPVSFKDVAAGKWYAKSISFIAAREITIGTGNGNFSPEAKLTRGQFIVMLMKAYDITPDTNPKDNFKDAGSTYYTGYLAAAKRYGISVGVGNNLFAPEKEITRQEMFTLMYNVLKAISKLPQGNSSKSLSSFSDADDIAPWAKDATKLLVETGTISGSGGNLTPFSTTTRAEMTQVLYNLLGK